MIKKAPKCPKCKKTGYVKWRGVVWKNEHTRVGRWECINPIHGSRLSTPNRALPYGYFFNAP